MVSQTPRSYAWARIEEAVGPRRDGNEDESMGRERIVGGINRGGLQDGRKIRRGWRMVWKRK